MSRYFNDKFNAQEKSTKNPAFYEKNFNFGGQNTKLCFWDTAGQEQFDALNTIYYQGAMGALIAYDVTSIESFEKVKKWVNELREMVGKNTIFVILGNKADLIQSKSELDKIQVFVDEYAGKEKVKGFFVSAKTGYNINDAFEYFIGLIQQRITSEAKNHNTRKGGLQITKENPKIQKKDKCC